MRQTPKGLQREVKADCTGLHDGHVCESSPLVRMFSVRQRWARSEQVELHGRMR